MKAFTAAARAAVACAMVFATALACAQQNYPVKPIVVVIPFPPGTVVTSLPHYRAGKAQVLGVTGSKRAALMPNAPTFIESGYSKLDLQTWFALLGPAGLSKNAVTILSAGAAKALASKDVVDALANQGMEAAYAGPVELEAYMKARPPCGRGS